MLSIPVQLNCVTPPGLQLRRREMRNTRIMTERGDLPERMVVEYRQQRERMEALVVAEEGLREAMGREK